MLDISQVGDRLFGYVDDVSSQNYSQKTCFKLFNENSFSIPKNSEFSLSNITKLSL